MTPESFLPGYFSTIYPEINDPKVMNSDYPKAIIFTEKGVTFLCRILTGGSHFYVEKLPSEKLMDAPGIVSNQLTIL
jgi:hypothetical protein